MLNSQSPYKIQPKAGPQFGDSIHREVNLQNSTWKAQPNFLDQKLGPTYDSYENTFSGGTGATSQGTPTAPTTPAGVPNKGPQGTRRAKGFTGRGNVQQPQVPPENIQRETIMQAKEINNDQKFPGWFTQTEIDEAGNKYGTQLQKFIDEKNLERAKGLAAQDPQLLKEITGVEIPKDQVGTMGGNAALAAGAQAVTQEQANKYLAKSGAASSGTYNVNAE